MFRVVLLLCGCGFQGVPGPADLLSSDLAGSDLSGSDLSMMVDHTGPGPLGALPPSFCCNSNADCRSRLCANRDGVNFCTDLCDSDDVCTAWGGAFLCDQLNGACLPSGITATCVPAEQYQYGTKPIGSCCAHGFAKSGQECLGGRCITSGADSNPFYCTQGCDSHSPCPGGYTCAAGVCMISGSVGSTSFTYSCQ